jgi:hypothetical protein
MSDSAASAMINRLNTDASARSGQKNRREPSDTQNDSRRQGGTPIA